jgi:hypothetical protein
MFLFNKDGVPHLGIVIFVLLASIAFIMSLWTQLLWSFDNTVEFMQPISRNVTRDLIVLRLTEAQSSALLIQFGQTVFLAFAAMSGGWAIDKGRFTAKGWTRFFLIGAVVMAGLDAFTNLGTVMENINQNPGLENMHRIFDVTRAVLVTQIEEMLGLTLSVILYMFGALMVHMGKTPPAFLSMADSVAQGAVGRRTQMQTAAA